VDCSNCARSAIYVHRSCFAHSNSERGDDLAHADRHLSEYQYSINYSASSVPILQLGISGQGFSEQQLDAFGQVVGPVIP
jgi:hypothetical protein